MSRVPPAGGRRQGAARREPPRLRSLARGGCPAWPPRSGARAGPAGAQPGARREKKQAHPGDAVAGGAPAAPRGGSKGQGLAAPWRPPPTEAPAHKRAPRRPAGPRSSRKACSSGCSPRPRLQCPRRNSSRSFCARRYTRDHDTDPGAHPTNNQPAGTADQLRRAGAGADRGVPVAAPGAAGDPHRRGRRGQDSARACRGRRARRDVRRWRGLRRPGPLSPTPSLRPPRHRPGP